MYPEIMVIPMREELTRAGVSEARTAAEVDTAIAQLNGAELNGRALSAQTTAQPGKWNTGLSGHSTGRLPGSTTISSAMWSHHRCITGCSGRLSRRLSGLSFSTANSARVSGSRKIE